VAAAVDARVTRVERLVVDWELALVSDGTTERLRRLCAGSASSRSSSRSWKLSAVSSSSAVWRPRLSFGRSVMVEDEVGVEVEVEVEDVGAGAAAVFVFVRLLRCLLVDCFALVFVLVVVTLALRGEEGRGSGSEPIVAVVEILLNEECVEVSLVMDVVDPMVVMVEVLRSADGFGTLLDAEVGFKVRMESSMSAMA